MNSQQKKEKVCQLWRDSFHDEESFIDLFFSRKYCDENTFVLERESEIAAALQAIPYEMSCWHTPFLMAYMAGVSTPSHLRNLGLMSGLIAQSLNTLCQRGYVLSTLIPAETWLIEYYNRFGYAVVVNQTEEQYSVSDRSENAAKLFSIDQQYNYFFTALAQQACAVYHSRSDFDTVLADLQREQGEIIVVSESGRITGMAFLLPQNRYAVVLAWMYDSEIAQKQLLAACAQQAHVSDIRVKLGSVQSGKPFAMARIIQVKPLLSQFATRHPQMQLHIQVSDPLIAENNRCFSIDNGVCQSIPATPNTPTISINDLTTLLICGGKQGFPIQIPQISLMLN